MRGFQQMHRSLDRLAIITALLMSTLVASCTSDREQSLEVGVKASAVVFGDDDRMDVGDGSPYEIYASSVAALVPFSSLAGCTDGRCDLFTSPYGETVKLCADEKFAAEPTAAICTGFLVADNVIATAGHCVADQAACEALAFVFGFAHDSTLGDKQTKGLETYACAKLLTTTTTDRDYALIQLERAVVDHPVLPLHDTPASVDDDLVVLGHPYGLPLKIMGGGKVLELEGDFLHCNLDSAGGTSGAPVINAGTGEVEGILVLGPARTYTLDTTNMCYRERICDPESCDESWAIPYGLDGTLDVQATLAPVVATALAGANHACDAGI